MKREWVPAMIAGMVTLGFAPGARAASLSLDTVTPVVAPGEAVSIDVNVAGLGALAPPSLSAFDLGVDFDDGVLLFVGVTFDGFLGSGIQGSGETGGVVDLAETSLLLPSALDALQPGTFRLARIDFQALSAGSSTLSFVDVLLGDGLGDPLALEGTAGISVTVLSGVIPEPRALVLLAAGLGLLGVGRVADRASKGTSRVPGPHPDGGLLRVPRRSPRGLG